MFAAAPALHFGEVALTTSVHYLFTARNPLTATAKPQVSRTPLVVRRSPSRLSPENRGKAGSSRSVADCSVRRCLALGLLLEQRGHSWLTRSCFLGNSVFNHLATRSTPTWRLPWLMLARFKLRKAAHQLNLILRAQHGESSWAEQACGGSAFATV